MQPKTHTLCPTRYFARHFSPYLISIYLCLLAAAFSFLKCNLSESEGNPKTLTLHLDDSLKADAGKYDSLQIDLYKIQGEDTLLVQNNLLAGPYLEAGQVKSQPLNADVGKDFLLILRGYKNDELKLQKNLRFENSKPKVPEVVQYIPEAGTHPVNPIDTLKTLPDTLKTPMDTTQSQLPPDSSKLEPAPEPVLDTTPEPPVNRPPVLSIVGMSEGAPFPVKEKGTLKFFVTVTEPDSGQKVFLLTPKNMSWGRCGSGSFDTTSGAFSFTPFLQCVEKGDTTFTDLTFLAQDNNAPSAMGELKVKIIVYDSNSAPTWSAGTDNRQIKEGETAVWTVKAADAEGDALSFQLKNLDSLKGLFPANANAIAFLAGGDSARITFSPGTKTGNVPFDLVVSDGKASQTKRITVSVGNVNKPPTLAIVGHSGGPLVFKEGQTRSYTVQDTDPDAGDKVFLLKMQNLPLEGCGSAGFDNATGIFTFSPTFKCLASGDFTYPGLIFSALDNGSPPERGELTVDILVVDSNSAPAWKQDSVSLSLKEGQEMIYDFSPLFLGDAEGDSVSFTADVGTVTGKIWKWTPNFAEARARTGRITARDNHRSPAQSTLKLKLAIEDSTRGLKVDITSPANGFLTNQLTVPVAWMVDGKVQPVKDEALSNEGENSITRSHADAFGNTGSMSIKVIRDTKPPEKPAVSGPALTQSRRPQWTWLSGGDGNGTFRYKLDNGDMSSGTTQTQALTLTPGADLADGNHALYVQEQDGAGNWSASGSAVVVVDATLPKIEFSSYADGHVTNKAEITVLWKIDGANQTPFAAALSEGENTITKTHADVAGNLGSGTIKVYRRSRVTFVSAAATGTNDGSSWVDAFRELKTGLDKATSGELWVAKGTYKPDLGTGVDDSSFQMKAGLNLFGGFDGTENLESARNWRNNPTILSGDIGVQNVKDDNSYIIVYGSSNCYIDGFTITQARGTGLVNNLNSSDVRNCIFSQNGNEKGGEGGAIYNQYVNPSIENCVFESNLAHDGGAIYNFGSSPKIVNCIFKENKAINGGAVYTFGLFTSDPVEPSFQNCIFYGNSATGNGGTMYNEGGSPIISSSTFTKNTANSLCGGIITYKVYGGKASPIISNSIFWGNVSTGPGQDLYVVGNSPAPTDPSEPVYNSDTLTIRYSSLSGGISGVFREKEGIAIKDIEGNISGDPKFKNSTDIDGADNILPSFDDGLSLQAGSPCIKAGSEYGYNTPRTDITGKTRPDGKIDLGAYEQ